MTVHTSLLELTTRLIHDESARSAFSADPDGFLAEHGIVDLSPADVSDGLGHVADALPPHLAVQLASPGDGDVGTLVEQFRVVSDVDADFVLPELEPDADFLVGDHEVVGDEPDVDPDVDPHGVLDDAPESPGAVADADDSSGDPAGVDVGDTADAGFGSGGDDTPTELGDASTGFEVDLTADVSGFETVRAEFEDPAAFDEAGTFDDPFLAPEPVDAEAPEPDDLDSDNGNWDGSWDHDDGHGML